MGLSSSCMPAANKLELIWINAQERWLRRMDNPGTSAAAAHLVTGLRGEQAALFELRRRGVVVVARRWISPKMRGDIDLIGWDGSCLCFVEVKTRTARDLRPAELAVDEDKREMIRGLARAYLHVFPESERRTVPVRFDVISVYAIKGVNEFEFFKGAFHWR